ncbi:MAG: ATP-binding protein [Pseudomonadota bacterium]
MAKSYQVELEEIRSLESLDSLEFKFQILLVGLAVVAGWLALGLTVLLFWFVLHYALVIGEKLLLTYRPHSASWQLYAFVLFLNAAIGLTFSAVPVFLWSHNDDVYQFAAMAMLVGATLNTFLIRARNWHVMLCYVVPNGFAFAWISYLIFQQVGFGAETIVAAVVLLCVLIYFGVSVTDAYRSHKAHADTLDRLARAQRVEALGNLSAGIAHDFNNLLNVISGNLELLRDEVTDRKNGELITQSLQAVERGANITGQLLAFGGKSPLRPKAVDLSIVFIQLEHMLARLLPKSLTLDISAEKGLPLVHVDEAALQTALINLAVNSRDSMMQGGTLVIKAEALQANDEKATGGGTAPQRVLITVSDDGSGIVPDIISRVTDPFFTTKRDGKGAGLGLAMVQGFVAQSGGHLDIRNRPSGGTEISFSLAALAGSGLDEAPQRAQRISTQPVGGSVLVVEDEAQLRTLICQRLRNDGFEVKDADNGTTALFMIEAGLKPDVLVTDIVMPGPVQGDQLIKELHRIHPGTPTIAMSGYARTEDCKDPPQQLGDVFIQKPASLAAISQAVQEFIGATTARDAITVKDLG